MKDEISKTHERKSFNLYNKKPHTKLSKDIYSYGVDTYK